MNAVNTQISPILANIGTSYNTILPRLTFQQLVTNGTFDIAGFELRNDSFRTKEYGDIVCPDGYLFVSQKCSKYQEQ